MLRAENAYIQTISRERDELKVQLVEKEAEILHLREQIARLEQRSAGAVQLQSAALRERSAAAEQSLPFSKDELVTQLSNAKMSFERLVNGRTVLVDQDEQDEYRRTFTEAQLYERAKFLNQRKTQLKGHFMTHSQSVYVIEIGGPSVNLVRQSNAPPSAKRMRTSSSSLSSDANNPSSRSQDEIERLRRRNRELEERLARSVDVHENREEMARLKATVRSLETKMKENEEAREETRQANKRLRDELRVATTNLDAMKAERLVDSSKRKAPPNATKKQINDMVTYQRELTRERDDARAELYQANEYVWALQNAFRALRSEFIERVEARPRTKRPLRDEENDERSEAEVGSEDEEETSDGLF